MSGDYKEEATKYKDNRNISVDEEHLIKHKKKLKITDRPYVLVTVYKPFCMFKELSIRQGKYTTLSQAKQALEHLKKNKAFLIRHIKEMYIYNIANKYDIFEHFKVE